jgi:hypothetical protein
MNARPYSIRDLRTLFKGDTLRRNFGADYEPADRRWRFASRQDAIEARDFISDVSVFFLHDPGLARQREAVKVRGGFSIMARNDNDGIKRGTAFFAFQSYEECFDAQRDLRRFTLATTSDTADTLNRCDKYSDLLNRDLRQVVHASEVQRLTQAEVMRLNARIDAALASQPASAGDERASAGRATESARDREPDFEPHPWTPTEGDTVIGMLLGRSDHHLAVRSDEHGDLLLERWKIAMPLARNSPRELTFNSWRAIGIEFDSEGHGRALQIQSARKITDGMGRLWEDERDPTMGPLTIRTMMAAEKRGVLPILEYEDANAEDLDGDIVCLTDDVVSILDNGAYASFGYRSAFKDATIGQHVRTGPTFRDTAPTLARRR